jgi:hypothetical protein
VSVRTGVRVAAAGSGKSSLVAGRALKAEIVIDVVGLVPRDAGIVLQPGNKLARRDRPDLEDLRLALIGGAGVLEVMPGAVLQRDDPAEGRCHCVD